jgi:hypothetical protein
MSGGAGLAAGAALEAALETSADGRLAAELETKGAATDGARGAVAAGGSGAEAVGVGARFPLLLHESIVAVAVAAARLR